MAKTYRDLFTANGTNTTNMRRLFSAIGAAEGNINQSKCNDHESKCNRNISVYFRKAHHSILSSNQKAVSKHNIAPAISVVNINLFEINDRSEKFGSINAAPIQPAAKLVNKPESTLNLALENKIINYNYNQNNYQYQMASYPLNFKFTILNLK